MVEVDLNQNGLPIDRQPIFVVEVLDEFLLLFLESVFQCHHQAN